MTAQNMLLCLKVILSQFCFRFCCCYFLNIYLLIFRGRGRERERNSVREKHRSVDYTPCSRIKLATQACALTRNRVHNLSVHSMILHPTATQQPGLFCFGFELVIFKKQQIWEKL